MDRKEYEKELETFFTTGLTLMKAKNADYAGKHDPFHNFNMCQALGVCSVEQGILVRMIDKFARINNLINKEAEVKDETILDTLQDLANYSAILQVYIKQKGGKDVC